MARSQKRAGKAEKAAAPARSGAEKFNIPADEIPVGKIAARVIDARSGLRTFENIHAVRMNDSGLRRLFMNDYTPTLGKVMGDVSLLIADREVSFENIRGFYKLQHNMFTLLIEEHLEKPAATPETPAEQAPADKGAADEL